jgi:hypothetical protein
LSACSHEPLEVEKIAPAVTGFLTQIREQGLRAVLARRYPVQEAAISEPRISS